jgi:hypothetical protein
VGPVNFGKMHNCQITGRFKDRTSREIELILIKRAAVKKAALFVLKEGGKGDHTNKAALKSAED